MTARNRLEPAAGKTAILAFIGNYLPSQEGGILRTVVNTVEHLGDEFEFLLVTKDRDLRDRSPFPGVRTDTWQPVGKAKVFYLSPESRGIIALSRIIASTRHHVLFLNSFFEPLTIKVLLARKFSRTREFAPVIVAPRGDFGWASLRLKYPKKFLFIQAAKALGLYRDVVWHASSEREAGEIMRVMGVRKDQIRVAPDLPIRNSGGIPAQSRYERGHERLRLVFLSRIAREKNLDFALNVLSRVKTPLSFDIYGPTEDPVYWAECKLLISQLPRHLTVTYLGKVDPDRVIDVFGRYDLFLFPTGGENYGHVIAECLSAGTPVLTSTETPWRGLQAEGLGWDLELKQLDSFVQVIDNFLSLDVNERLAQRESIKKKASARLQHPAIIQANRQLFGESGAWSGVGKDRDRFGGARPCV